MRHTLVFLILLIFKNAGGQNLVPNGSFEDINICTEFTQPCSPSAWFYINKQVKGYGNSSFKPVRGDKYLNLLVVDTTSPGRDYWQTMLLCPLEKGKTYTISLRLASEYIGPNLHDIGIYFGNEFLFYANDTVVHPKHFFSFLGGTGRMLKSGWYEVRKQFIAPAQARFLLVGNFSDKTNKQITKERRLTIKHLYMAIDDLRIIPNGTATCITQKKIKDSLYAIKNRHAYARAPVSSVVKQGPATLKKTDTILVKNIEFDFDSYQIKNSDSLRYLRPILSDRTIKKIIIAGFTDNAGSTAYNKTLSEKRAYAVARFFVVVFGLSDLIIETDGKGISTSYPDPSQNRRVEIYIYR